MQCINQVGVLHCETAFIKPPNAKYFLLEQLLKKTEDNDDHYLRYLQKKIFVLWEETLK